MRVFGIILGLGLGVVFLQYRLWVSEQGLREVARLQSAISVQSRANRDLEARNRQLGAEVNNLKIGLTALEERARSELGMVGKTETFYQIVTSATAMPAAPATTVTARAE